MVTFPLRQKRVPLVAYRMHLWNLETARISLSCVSITMDCEYASACPIMLDLEPCSGARVHPRDYGCTASGVTGLCLQTGGASDVFAFVTEQTICDSTTSILLPVLTLILLRDPSSRSR